MARQTLAQWIHECATDTDKTGQLRQIQLVHMVGQQRQEIDGCKFGGSKDLSIEALGQRFRSKAEAYCQDMPGVQMFMLLAFFGESREEEARHPFAINVNQHGENGLMTENPTTQGMTQQHMRHAEMLVQQVYRRQQSQDEFQLRLMERMESSLGRLQGALDNEIARRLEATDIAMQLLGRENDRYHEQEMERMRFERSTAERKKWLAFGPPLINSLLGREVFPQSTADTAMVESIIENLPMEDIAKIGGSLPPTVLGPLMARVQKYHADKEKDEKELEALTPPKLTQVVDPAADAAGRVQPITSITKRNQQR
jgi:hypothetical protein